jgi:hydroxyacylglutathione hydrolase
VTQESPCHKGVFSMMHVKVFEFNPLQENTCILYDDTKECVVIDPGCYDKDEEDQLSEFIKENDLHVKLLLNTHCHIDHILGNYFVKKTFGVKLLIHPLDEPVLKAAKVYAPSYGLHRYNETEVDGYLQEGDTISFGNQHLKILFVPGHAPGHVAFYHKEGKIVIGGDVLFYNSIGRTDLPGGNYQTLIRSIHQQLFTLPDDVTVYPGHGPATTIGFEKRTNPFCALT